jgi:hypothetical protein
MLATPFGWQEPSNTDHLVLVLKLNPFELGDHRDLPTYQPRRPLLIR